MGGQLWAGVRERVRSLAEADPRPKVFGADDHGFRLARVLSAEELADLESLVGARLPEEYRDFLLQVGAGGAGPAYGVYPVERGERGWQWTGDWAALADEARLAEPFPVAGPDPEVMEVLLGQCPQEEDFADVAEFDSAYEAWDERWAEVMWDPDRTVGAVVLCDLGCGRRQWLVVSGSEAGRIWSDDRIDGVGLAPLLDEAGRPVTFARWYLDWLDRAEQQV
jgi:hypothetical protein